MNPPRLASARERGPGRSGGQGQTTIEWTGLVLLVCLLALGVLAALGARLPATGLARTVAARLICAAGLSDACAVEPELVAAYGAELAGQVERNAPRIIYEQGMTALPVDFRSCRGGRCGNGPDAGRCGAPTPASPQRRSCTSWTAVTTGRWSRRAARRIDCSGERAGHLYIQYWLYYEDSTSLRDLPGRRWLPRGRLGGLSDPCWAGRGRGQGDLAPRLQLPRRAGKLAFRRGHRPPLRLGPFPRPPVRLGRQPRRPRRRGRPAIAAALDARRSPRADPDRDPWPERPAHPLRDHPAVAQTGLPRSGGRGDVTPTSPTPRVRRLEGLGHGSRTRGRAR